MDDDDFGDFFEEEDEDYDIDPLDYYLDGDLSPSPTLEFDDLVGEPADYVVTSSAQPSDGGGLEETVPDVASTVPRTGEHLDFSDLLSLLSKFRPKGKKASRPKGKKASPKLGKELSDVVLKASWYGYVRVLEEVKRRGLFKSKEQPFDFCSASNKRYSPLMHACEGKRVEAIRFLLDNGAKVFYSEKRKKGAKHKKVTGVTALHVACVTGNTEILGLLLTAAREKGQLIKTNLNAKTKDGVTPFMYAVKEGHTELMQALLDTGIVDLTLTNKKGQNVFHMVARMGRVDYLSKLHPLATALATETTPPHFTVTDQNGWNILHHACSGGSVEVLKWLFDHIPALKEPNALNAQTKRGYTPLLCACEYQKVDVVKALLGLPVDGSPRLDIPPRSVKVELCAMDKDTGEGEDTGSLSCLHIAATHETDVMLEIASILLSKGCPMDVVNAKGNTALHMAVQRSNQLVEKVLRAHCTADVLAMKNKAGETADEMQPDDVIPAEIRRRGPEAIEVYRKALQEGKTKIPRCNVLILGEERMGKTSLLKLLLEKEFNPEQEPTRGIDNTVVDTVDNRAVNLANWTEVNREYQVKENEEVIVSKVAGELGNHLPRQEQKDEENERVSEEELLRIVERIAKRRHHIPYSLIQPPLGANRTGSRYPELPSLKSSEDNSSQISAQLQGADDEGATPSPPTTHPQHPRNRPLLPPRPASQQGADRPSTPPEEPHPQPQQLEALPQQPKSRRTSSGISRQHSAAIGRQWRKGDHKVKELPLHLSMYDFAGQKEYRPMHHCFIVRRAIYLVVFNLQLIFQLLQGEQRQPNPLEEIRYWLNSIHAHIHTSDEDDKKMKTVFLVGTHREPQNSKQGKPISTGELSEINEELKRAFYTNDKYHRCVNHLQFVVCDFPTEDDNMAVFTAVENSMDGSHERETSGANPLKQTLHKICSIKKTTRDESDAPLPFLEEYHPILWLQFEEKLITERRRREKASLVAHVEEVVKLGEQCGISGGKDVETALDFFHDTGTIVLLKQLPTLFLEEWERKELEDLVLLDPKWLINVMKELMELQKKRLVGADARELDVTGKAKESLLRDCWKGFYDERNEASFRRLCLMLQAYCLIYPIRGGEQLSHPPRASRSTPSQQSLPTQPLRSQSERVDMPQPTKLFLVPCKFPFKEQEESGVKSIKLCFDFCDFLPAEIYHRFVCLMLSKTKQAQQSEFSKFWCQFHEVLECPILKVTMKEEHHVLEVSIRFGPEEMRSQRPIPLLYLIHDHLLKICRTSGLKGLTYIGGPRLKNCPNPSEDCPWGPGPPAVLPIVSYPEKEPEQRCKKCLHAYDFDQLLNPEYAKPCSRPQPRTLETAGASTLQGTQPEVAGSGLTGNGHSQSTILNIHAHQAIVATPGSSLTLPHPGQQPPMGLTVAGSQALLNLPTHPLPSSGPQSGHHAFASLPHPPSAQQPQAIQAGHPASGALQHPPSAQQLQAIQAGQPASSSLPHPPWAGQPALSALPHTLSLGPTTQPPQCTQSGQHAHVPHSGLAPQYPGAPQSDGQVPIMSPLVPPPETAAGSSVTPTQQKPLSSQPTTPLSSKPPTVKELMKLLYSEVPHEWYAIGKYLEITTPDLEVIRQKHLFNPHECLVGMLDIWVKRSDPPASWEAMAEALQVVRRKDIATEIITTMCP